ncbi:MAG: CDP-diacylglycerol--glycerol-3-phosphate 3-phosphatidyltransferase [Tissierellia bacterium]|nr:CDP-diacylglycerol--glycerol-3-phosphate 3-phosphatidyltransferase [Tissierellia bacterium]
MNLANKITIFRILLTPIFVLSFYMSFYTNPIIPLVIFCLASFTDFLDGYIARSRNLVTDFGKFIDPLADKLLTMAAFVLLASNSVIPAWIVITILARELIITGFRTIAVSKGVTIAASQLGKFKTVSQMAIIIISFFGKYQIRFYALVFNIVLYLALLMTIVSGYDYIYKNKDVFGDEF